MTYDGTILAKPTWYAGIEFRSRLEARWASWFDDRDILWEYEPKSFDINTRYRYTPDFFLRSVGAQGTYVEIKGSTPTAIELDRLWRLWNLRASEGPDCALIIGFRPDDVFRVYSYGVDWSSPGFEQAHETNYAHWLDNQICLNGRCKHDAVVNAVAVDREYARRQLANSQYATDTLEIECAMKRHRAPILNNTRQEWDEYRGVISHCNDSYVVSNAWLQSERIETNV